MERLLRKIFGSMGQEFRSESHVVAEIYHQLRSEAGLDTQEVILEAPYTGNTRKKCDILIRQTGHREVWIEVKGYFASESPSTRSKKHTGELSSPGYACEKLHRLASTSLKILIIYQNCNYNPQSENSLNALEECCRLKQIVLIHTPPKNIIGSSRQ
jgi:hypothetical protein